MSKKAQFATVHRIRFREIVTPEMLQLASIPTGALSWKIGPSGPVGADGYRLPADVWCAMGLYHKLESAKLALQEREQFMPFLADAAESWHALVAPFAHKGECNYLNRSEPGTLFEVSKQNSEEVCMVITTAGFVTGPGFVIEKVIDFRRNVDATKDWLAKADGCLALQVFTPYTVGDDGVTLSIWKDDASMLAAAYRPGFHRSQIDRHKQKAMMDRSSFTRFRILESWGEWDGCNPIAAS